jgi:hypothetical protein
MNGVQEFSSSRGGIGCVLAFQEQGKTDPGILEYVLGFFFLPPWNAGQSFLRLDHLEVRVRQL